MIGLIVSLATSFELTAVCIGAIPLMVGVVILEARFVRTIWTVDSLNQAKVLRFLTSQIFGKVGGRRKGRNIGRHENSIGVHQQYSNGGLPK